MDNVDAGLIVVGFAPAGDIFRRSDDVVDGASAVNAGAKAADGCNSFAPGTVVLLADGTRKAIEDVEVGDEVLAADEETGEPTEGRPVTALIRGEGDKLLVALTVTDADGDTQQIVATDAHPFWDPKLGEWTDAIDLTAGGWLLARSGDWVQVSATDVQFGRAVVHNLTVAVDHTYYVLAGETPILVHNSNCPLTGGFKVGMSPDEITDLNRGFGGETLLSGTPANTMANASRYNSFWDKSAVVIRDIAGGHMFNNGNKRTAQAVVEQLMERKKITSGPSSADLRSVIDRVGKGQLREVSDISAALRGF